MEASEVDVQDYVGIIWKHKWIILGVSAIALVVGVIVSFILPNEYEASTLLQLKSSPFRNHQLQLPAASVIIALIQANQDPNGPRLEVEILNNGGFVSLWLGGAFRPQELEETLSLYITIARTFLEEEVQQDIQDQIMVNEHRQSFLNQQRANLLEELHRWIVRRQEGLVRQSQSLRAELEQLLESGRQTSPVQSSILDQSYAMLASQLQAIETSLALLETEQESTFPQPRSGFDGQLAAIDLSLRELAVSKSELQRMLEMGWTPLRAIHEPLVERKPLWPRRKLILAIAAVTGVVLGILFAFFIHYLESTPSCPDPRKRTPSDTA